MKYCKNNRGFTLIEMMVVLFVITILLIITIPNATKHNETIKTKGCDGLIRMVEAQMQAYLIDEGVEATSITELKSKNYLPNEDLTCPGGETVTIQNGKVVTS